MRTYEGSHISDFRKLSINQITLLRHASSVNYERSDEYSDWKKQFEDEDGKSKTKVRVKARANDMSEIPSHLILGQMMPMG